MRFFKHIQRLKGSGLAEKGRKNYVSRHIQRLKVSELAERGRKICFQTYTCVKSNRISREGPRKLTFYNIPKL